MPRTRIVAVDDDRRILRVLKRACENVGYEVHSVLDAEYFESSFRVFEPSLVFLDLNMHGIDGVALLRFIAEEHSNTSVIVTSGVDECLLDDAQSLGLSLGLRMLTPIRKPLMVSDVRRRLDAFRAQRRDAARTSLSGEELAEALERGHLEVCYQPQIDLRSQQVVCAEALARLRRPGSGIVGPEQFIAVAEGHALIDALTFGVLDDALGRLRGWQRHAPGLQVAVNLSPCMLGDATLPDHVFALLDAHAVRPEHLVLEVTETSLPADRQRAGDTLRRLRDHGIHLALDDFGSGYCSLGHLYESPYGTLKLDRKFAMRAEQDPDAAATIGSCLELARAVGLDVVAEGVHNESTLRWLAMHGCHQGQGFHICPPLFAAEFGAWLEAHAMTSAAARGGAAVSHTLN